VRRRRWIALALVAGAAAFSFGSAAPPAAILADTTPPSITPTVAGTAGQNGWYTSQVVVSWTVTDPESPIASSSGCDATTLTTDTVGTTLTCAATNGVGLSASTSVVVKIDTSGPVVSANTSGPPTNKGWYTQPVTVTFTGADPVSGIVSCTPPITYSGPDTKTGSVNGSCKNGAGIATSASESFKYDSSSPTISPSVSGTLGANGWYTSNVAVSWAVADPQSEIASSSGCDPSTVTADTTGTVVTCSATNDAGLAAQATAQIKIDRQLPETTLVEGPTGTVASSSAAFGFSASEAGASFECSRDGGAFAACSSPQTYSGLAEGDHSFAVRALDPAGNVDATPAARAWKVRTAAPTLHLAANQLLEATGPEGSVAMYSVTADDAGEPVLPQAIACRPPSGSTFGLGSTTVTCQATNRFGVTTQGSFLVRVVDSTPPRLTVPAPLRVNVAADSAVPATNPAISAFLSGARAADIVDPQPTVTSDAPVTFPMGTTAVKFTAKDDSGNAISASTSLTIVVGAAGRNDPPAAVDRTPPGDVRDVAVTAGDGSVTLTWRPPVDTDFDHVDVFRSGTAPGSTETQVFGATAQRVVDRGVQNDVVYRYVLVAVDKAGNHAAGVAVVAAPKASLLLTPKEGAQLKAPPLLTWRGVVEATYYNVQLWRGDRKLLSSWPIKNRLPLRMRWTYKGRPYALTPGTYRWYVWPGLGARADVRYGPMLGMQSFTITR
jgi:hypothetical protein